MAVARIQSLWERIPLHPLLFGWYAIIALYAQNMVQVRVNVIYRSLLVHLVLSTLALIFIRWGVKDWARAGLILAVFIVPFYSYGHVYAAVEGAQLMGFNFGRHRVLLLVWAAIVAVVLWLVIQRRIEPSTWTQFLNVVAVAATLLSIFQIVNYARRLPGLDSSSSQVQNEGAGWSSGSSDLVLQPGETPPDIYYIILDMYVRDDVLADTFHFDNSEFLASLEKAGFFVARCSQSNYQDTPLSLAASLNMDYLESFAAELMDRGLDHYSLEPYIHENRARSILQDLGYQVVNVESGFFLTEWSNADLYLTWKDESLGYSLALGGLNEFESMLLHSTAGMLINEYRSAQDLILSPILDQPYIERRNQILYALDTLEGAAAIPSPKFMFVHIVAPHPPFVFGPEGEFFPRQTPLTLNADVEDLDIERYIRGYTSQVTYVNNRIEGIIDRLIAESATPPVIILQGDHGTTRFASKRDKFGILNAYYLPGGDSTGLDHRITPVNSFRVIFDQYFNGHFGVLEDRSYFLEIWSDPYDFIPVPNTRTDCDVWEGK